jgi:hypothetical protein
MTETDDALVAALNEAGRGGRADIDAGPAHTQAVAQGLAQLIEWERAGESQRVAAALAALDAPALRRLTSLAVNALARDFVASSPR